MITVPRLIENLQRYVDIQITEMAKTSPMMGFMKPLISRAATNAIGKADKALSLLADKDGNIDIENIISEMRDSVLTSQPFTVNLPVLGDVEIGNGLIMANIPMINKRLVLNRDDLNMLKEMLIIKS
jgi:hypothetical protein